MGGEQAKKTDQRTRETKDSKQKGWLLKECTNLAYRGSVHMLKTQNKMPLLFLSN